MVAVHPLLAGLAQTARPGFDEIRGALSGVLPLLDRLPDTPQDPEWHAEGDVAVHTDLVLRAAYDLADRDGLAGEERLTLGLAAALHDIGKALTTRRAPDDSGRERIISPRHADRGRSYLAYRILELDLPYGVVWNVLALVGHHHDLGRVAQQGTEAAFRRLARQVNLRALHRLESADVAGRVMAGPDRFPEQLELFELYAREYGVWDGEDPYAGWRDAIGEALSDQPEALIQLTTARGIEAYEAGLIHTPEEAVARSYAARGGFPKLTVMCGPSGSGKTVWLAHQPPQAVVSLDDLRAQLAGKRSAQELNGQVLQAAQEALRVQLRARAPVAWDATGTRAAFRAKPLGLGEDYGALTTLVVFHLPPSVLARQNAARLEAVPAQVLATQLEAAEFPYLTEAHRTLVLGEDGRELLRFGFD